MQHPPRLPDEYLATLSEHDNLFQAQMAIDSMREERLRFERQQHQDGALVRAARVIERALWSAPSPHRAKAIQALTTETRRLTESVEMLERRLQEIETVSSPRRC